MNGRLLAYVIVQVLVHVSIILAEGIRWILERTGNA